jgi:hypothetical protein
VIDPGGGTLLEIRIVRLAAPPHPLVKVYGFKGKTNGQGGAAVYDGGLNGNERLVEKVFEGGDVLLWYAAFPSHLPDARVSMASREH